MADIVLVGTVHRDPHGHHKLLSLLHREDPEYITLEMSPYAVEFRKKKRVALTKKVCDMVGELGREGLAVPYPDPFSHPTIGNVLTLVDFPYEYLTASFFSKSRHIPFECIDKSYFSKKRLSKLERELITKENLRALIRWDPEEFKGGVDREYTMATLAFKSGQMTIDRSSNHQELVTRDRYMAKRIRKLLRSLNLRKLVHIGGWEHLVDAEKRETLFTLLSDLHPQRVLLPRSP